MPSGQLAIVRSKEIQSFIARKIRPPNETCIGLRMSCRLRKLVWVTGEELEWCIVHDFCLLYSAWRERDVETLELRLDGHPGIRSRPAELERSGILHTTKLGKGEVGLLNAAQFIRLLESELNNLLGRFRAYYPTYGSSS